jgi:LCP family protein required for cell wall assembly
LSQEPKAPKQAAAARHSNQSDTSLAGRFFSALGKIVAVLVISSLTVVALSAWQLQSELDKHKIHIPVGASQTPPNINGPINLLLVGSDTRAGQGMTVFGNSGGNLADVIILLHIAADRQSAVALSFPRDLLVPWPHCPSTTGGPGYLPQTLGQINATISNGGPGCTLLTVEQLTGLSIPYLAMIDFKGVIELSNVVGGVNVCVAKDINDPYTNTYLKAGAHTLQGLQALQFLRTRHGVGDGSDLTRISNQQVFLTSLVRKIKSKDVLSNPVTLYGLAAAASRNMVLSDTLADNGTLVAIAMGLKAIPMKNITFLQLPSIAGLPAPYSGRVKPDAEKSQILFDLIAQDKPLVLSKANTGYGGAVVVTPSPTPTPSASGKATPRPKASASGKPAPSPSPSISALPDWAEGTNAATTTCSKGN